METQELRITYINCEIPENQNSIALFLNFHWTQRAQILSFFNHIPTRNSEYFKIRCKECAYNNISRIPTTIFRGSGCPLDLVVFFATKSGLHN